MSLYANHIEGLQQGTIVSNTFQNEGQVFPPVKSVQREVGVKVDWGRFTTTVSAYEIAQPAQITIPNAPRPIFSIDGENENCGLELNTFGEIASGLRLLGGVAFMDARQRKTQNGTNDGKRSIGIPDVQVSLGTEWDMPFISGLTLTGCAIHFGDAYADAANTSSFRPGRGSTSAPAIASHRRGTASRSPSASPWRTSLTIATP